MFDEDYYFEDEYSESERETEYYEQIIKERQDNPYLFEDEEDDEEWRDIPGYEGLYQASNKGRIKSLGRIITRSPKGPYYKPEQILTPYVKPDSGYARVTIRKDNKEWRGDVHILIARTFIPNDENKPFIDHIDTNRTNNNVNNLQWVTRQENANNELSRYHHSIALKGRESKLKGREISRERIEKGLLSKQENGVIHLLEDENGNLIYKNGIIEVNKYK